MEFKPSEYQIDIFDETIKKSVDTIAVNAVAGSGKTTTILNCLELLPKNKRIIFLAFNISIVSELKKKVPANIEVSTIHGFGSSMLRKWYGNKHKLVERKSFVLGLKLFSNWGIEEEKFSYVYRVSKLVDYMRINLVIDDDVQIAEIAARHSIPIFNKEIMHAKELLVYCDKNRYEMIDYIDMIYLPAIKNMKLYKYDYIFVDEAQDLSPAMQNIVKKMLNYNSRVIYVGDPRQAIYAFAGSDSDSFYNFGRVIGRDVKEMPLSVCYRCGKNIVKEAQMIVPHIEYSEHSKLGVVRQGIVEDISGKMSVVCRNNKPLVQLFFDLLNRNIKANIKGKEYGDSIVKMIEKTRSTGVDSMLKKIEVDRVKLKHKLIDRGIRKPENNQSMIDFMEKRDIIKVFTNKTSSIPQIKKMLSNIFVDDIDKGIMLMTIHKSKGLEDDKVMFLNPELVPSNFANTDELLQQEYNLKYVATTRAKSELIYLNNYGNNLKQLSKDDEVE